MNLGFCKFGCLGVAGAVNIQGFDCFRVEGIGCSNAFLVELMAYGVPFYSVLRNFTGCAPHHRTLPGALLVPLIVAQENPSKIAIGEFRTEVPHTDPSNPKPSMPRIVRSMLCVFKENL